MYLMRRNAERRKGLGRMLDEDSPWRRFNPYGDIMRWRPRLPVNPAPAGSSCGPLISQQVCDQMNARGGELGPPVPPCDPNYRGPSADCAAWRQQQPCPSGMVRGSSGDCVRNVTDPPPPVGPSAPDGTIIDSKGNVIAPPSAITDIQQSAVNSNYLPAPVALRAAPAASGLGLPLWGWALLLGGALFLGMER